MLKTPPDAGVDAAPGLGFIGIARLAIVLGLRRPDLVFDGSTQAQFRQAHGRAERDHRPEDKGCMLERMKWLLLMIVIVIGILVWLFLIASLNRRNSAEFDRRARKARKFSSRVVHPPFKG